MNIKVESLGEKTQTRGILDMKILGIQAATIEVSFTNRIQETLEYKGKNGYTTIMHIFKEDTNSKKLSIYTKKVLTLNLKSY